MSIFFYNISGKFHKILDGKVIRATDGIKTNVRCERVSHNNRCDALPKKDGRKNNMFNCLRFLYSFSESPSSKSIPSSAIFSFKS